MIKRFLGNGSVFYNKSKNVWVCELRYIDENNETKRRSVSGVSEKDARKKGEDINASNEITSKS